MFGLDLISITAAAIAGGIGGAIGGALGLMTQSRPLRTVLIVVPVIVGAQFVAPLIVPFLDQSSGPAVRGGQFDTTYEREVLPEIEKVPALARIFREHPDVEARFRAMSREIYQKGGAKALVEQSGAIGATVLGEAFISYMPRARGEDLLMFATIMADILKALYDHDPEACILYQFGTKYGQPLGTARLLAAIGEDRQKKQVELMNAVVVNAVDQPIAFDDAKATAAVVTLSRKHVQVLTGKSAEVAQGARPAADAAEAKIACSFAVALFTDLATMDRATAELIMRKMFARQQAGSAG